jgi:hypothetical protein
MAMFGEILQVFAEKSPVTVMVHGLLERILNAEKTAKLLAAEG